MTTISQPLTPPGAGQKFIPDLLLQYRVDKTSSRMCKHLTDITKQANERFILSKTSELGPVWFTGFTPTITQSVPAGHEESAGLALNSRSPISRLPNFDDSADEQTQHVKSFTKMTHLSFVPRSAASHTQITPCRILRYDSLTPPKAPKSRCYFNPGGMPVSTIPLSYDRCESDKERVKNRRSKKDLEAVVERIRFQKEPFVQLDPDDEDQDLFWIRKKPMD
ncbi:hypothetical protein BKA61DRAFT_731063 [Leptodontidium sp. MPI-SDFR-AT-0119]|nr:hypothetical protein BKA61DRAFT_731063 [Leptodontidium sp. MPI-SDFR-AT-0119]